MADRVRRDRRRPYHQVHAASGSRRLRQRRGGAGRDGRLPDRDARRLGPWRRRIGAGICRCPGGPDPLYRAEDEARPRADRRAGDRHCDLLRIRRAAAGPASRTDGGSRSHGPHGRTGVRHHGRRGLCDGAARRGAANPADLVRPRRGRIARCAAGGTRGKDAGGHPVEPGAVPRRARHRQYRLRHDRRRAGLRWPVTNPHQFPRRRAATRSSVATGGTASPRGRTWRSSPR